MRDTGQADRYKDLEINYIDHHNPDLVLFDGSGEEVQRIDLTRIAWRLRDRDAFRRVVEALRATDSLSYSRGVARELVNAARQAIATLTPSPAASMLTAMADAVISRDH